jgi:transglutaminase-like putative cysteine protease
MYFAIRLTFVLSLLLSVAKAQNYSAALIPDSLKQNAHTVFRDATEEIELFSVNTGVRRVKKIITVLDQNGDEDAILSINYDKDSKVQIKQVNIYDKDGKRVKKIKQSDIMDIPAFDGATLYSDNRMYVYKPNVGDYPYTIEYEYNTEYKNMIVYGTWSPFKGYNNAVEYSKLSFIHSNDLQFKKKELNLTDKSTVTNKDNKVTETWEYKKIMAKEYEPYGTGLVEIVPVVYLMPVQLVYDKHIGTSNNWEEYGKWIYDLYAGRSELAEAEKTKITALLGNIPDTIQKIKKLYEYMQERTRYVGIQLGIGGYQPFTAQTVFENGYGDCKALSNYMCALLKQIGITSYPALVSSGRYIEPIYFDFPNFKQFDHVILCVPFKKDTIWLECTNQTIPYGFLGDFTDDRDVLLITEQGGKFAHTQKYTAEENLRIGNAEFDIDLDGTAKCTIQTKYKGLQYDQITDLLVETPEEQRKWVVKNSDLPSMQLNNYTIKNDKKKIPVATIDESSISRNYCSFTGNYMLLPLNMINAQGLIKKMVKKRTTDFVIPRSTIDYDTLVYKIPADLKIDFLPESKTIKSSYGDYSCSTKVKDKKIIYTRKFQLNQGRFKASAYNDFYEFILSVSKADNVKAMLVKEVK